MDPENPFSSELKPQQQQQNLPWWFKYLQKTICVCAGLICGILGILTVVSLSALCIVAGVFQIAIGFFVIVMEAPCCCSFIDFVDKISKFSEDRKPWQKATVYCVSAILPMALCPGIRTICGCSLIIISGLTYAYQALGRKASREEMRMKTMGSSSLIENAALIDQSVAPVHLSSQVG